MDTDFLDRAAELAESLRALDEPYATRAGDALAMAVQEIVGLERKADRRTVIGQASGIVMEREGVGPQTAFMTLVSISSHTNRKVHDIATELVTQGYVEGLEVPGLSSLSSPPESMSPTPAAL